MCGIAGYNVAPSIMEGVTHKTVRKMFAAGVRENLHRGLDATGYFVQYPDDPDHTWYWKAAMPGDKVLAQPKFYPQGVPNVMGIHTRAASRDYTPDDDTNNHPVTGFGLQVTHNGIIRSHKNYRFNKLSIEERNSMPDVDSAVINAHFRGITDPRQQFDDVIDRINNLWDFTSSGYAFHLVWEAHPGFSLIVRGPEYPMHAIIDKDKGLFVYGSQEASARKIADKFGRANFDPVKGNLYSGAAMIVDNGSLEWWGNFKASKPITNSGKAFTPPVPRARYNANMDPVFTSPTDKSHWSSENNPTSLCEAAEYDEETDLGVLLTIMEQGIVDTEAVQRWDKDQLKRQQNTVRVEEKFWAACCDANDAYVWVSKRSYMDARYFFIFDEVEVVFDYLFSFLDAYNWNNISDVDTAYNIYPWSDIPKEPEPEQEPAAVVLEDFNTWFSKSTTSKELDCEKYAPEDASIPKAIGGKTLGGKTTTTPAVVVGTDFETQCLNHPELFSAQFFAPCWEEPDIVVMVNLKCRVHGQMFEQHKHPSDCEEVMRHAYKVLGSCSTIERYLDIYGRWQTERVIGRCEKHAAEDIRWAEFTIDKEEYSFPVREGCLVDGCNYSLTLYPPLLDMVYTSNCDWLKVKSPV